MRELRGACYKQAVRTLSVAITDIYRVSTTLELH
jgi:hypothetical protein